MDGSPPPDAADPPLRVGDMVWGKVKSHPWWPGHIYDDSFAFTSVRRTRHDSSQSLVAFFGDSSYGWFDTSELLPFAPHYPSKSTQTTSRPFLRAVHEAADEASRRAALSISCRCRNPSNFRPADVPGYALVDVPGYEPGALYSNRQIEESRALFVPEVAVGFVRDLAVVPLEEDDERTKDVGFMEMLAIALAYRKATYEEFDVTYAQAFGVEPVRRPPSEIRDFAQRAVPLSGQLKIAEALGGKKKNSTNAASLTPPPSSSASKLLVSKSAAGAAAAATTPASATKVPSSAKKDKYLLKRRDASGSLPLHVFPSANSGVLVGPDGGADTQPPSANAAAMPVAHGGEDNYMLQKRPAPAAPGDERSSDGVPPDGAGQTSAVVGVAAKKKVRKREEAEEESGEVRKKKKKMAALSELAAAAGSAQEVPRKILLKEQGRRDDEMPRRVPIPLPPLNLDVINVVQIFADLQGLAADPGCGCEAGVVEAVRGFILTRRAHLYQKSILNSPVAEPTSEENTAGHPAEPKAKTINVKAVKAPRDHGTASKEPKLKPKSEDAVDPGRKRAPSDLQEVMASNKKKKLDKMKGLAAEKKAGLTRKMIEDAAAVGTPAPRPMSKQKPIAKQAPAAPAVPSPTALLMKFPINATMPSVASLKARFARFGQLDLDGTRVYWKSYTCRVVFKFKSDAQTALTYARNNDVFGQLRPVYSLKDVGAPDSDTASQRPESQLPIELQMSMSGVVDNGGLDSPSVQRYQLQRAAVSQPKSILKKAGDDVSASAGGTPRDTNRVKFVLDSGSGKAELPSLTANSKNGNGNGGAKGNGAYGPGTGILKGGKSVSFGMPPAPEPPVPRLPIPAPSLQGPFRFDVPMTQAVDSITRMPPPPPIAGILQRPAKLLDPRLPQPSAEAAERAPQAGPANGGAVRPDGGGKPPVDISGDMMKLLLKCNDIVSTVKNTLGYMPYHAL